jgi:hypothetical protein
VTSKFILFLLVGAGAVLFFTARSPEVRPSTVDVAATVDKGALNDSRKRYYEKAINDLLQQKRRSPADDRKIQEMRRELNSL